MTAPISNKAYLAAAKRIHHIDTELEIDDSAHVYRNPNDDSGAYIQSWVWVARNAVITEDK